MLTPHEKGDDIIYIYYKTQIILHCILDINNNGSSYHVILQAGSAAEHVLAWMFAKRINNGIHMDLLEFSWLYFSGLKYRSNKYIQYI